MIYGHALSSTGKGVWPIFVSRHGCGAYESNSILKKLTPILRIDAFDEKKERCRVISEKAVRNIIEIHATDGLAWFAWGAFQEDPIAAMEELEDCTK